MSSAEKPWAPVLIAGIFTTVLTLFGLYMVTTNTDFNPMGWYMALIIPVGAILVGLLAASGYGLVSWFIGVKIKSWLLGVVLGIQLVAYGIAQYIEYLDFVRVVTPIQQELAKMTPEERTAGIATLPLQSEGLKAKLTSGQKPTFGDYFDENARSMTFKSSRYSSSDKASPIGMLGYGALLLQLIGFVGGSMISPLALAAHPFCENCQRYKQGKQLVVVPASVASKLFRKKDEAAEAAAVAEGERTLENLRQLALEGRASEFQEAIRQLQPAQKQANGLPSRYAVSVVRCPGCYDGHLKVQHMTGEGRNQNAVDMPDKQVELQPDFVRAITTG